MSRMLTVGETILGKYRIERQLAEGGMGVLFEAMHLQLEERVAVKVLKPEVLAGDSGASLVTRFLQEARSAIKIRSEHVVRVIDVGTLEDTSSPYIVMELLDGMDLDQVVAKSGPLPLPDAVDHLLQACEALAEAHARGIVHRDLKPANLFLTRRADGSPCVKILDFGISKVQSTTDVGITNTSAVMGSPRYMSPEQMRATRNVDARADIWAIGIILYELVTGAAPFDGATLTEVCAAIVADSPPGLSTLRPGVSQDIDAVAFKCLAKDPALRYANVAELADALAPFGGERAFAAATRIARVLRVDVASSPKLLSGTSTGPTPPSRADAPTQAAGMTSVAWGETPLVPKQSMKWPIAVALVAIPLVLGVGAFVVFRSPAPSAPPSTGSSVSAAVQPSATPSAVPDVAASAAPSSAPSASAAPAASTAPAASAVDPPAASAKPRAGRGTAKPPPKAPGGDLWGERK